MELLKYFKIVPKRRPREKVETLPPGSENRWRTYHFGSTTKFSPPEGLRGGDSFQAAGRQQPAQSSYHLLHLHAHSGFTPLHRSHRILHACDPTVYTLTHHTQSGTVTFTGFKTFSMTFLLLGVALLIFRGEDNSFRERGRCQGSEKKKLWLTSMLANYNVSLKRWAGLAFHWCAISLSNFEVFLYTLNLFIYKEKIVS